MNTECTTCYCTKCMLRIEEEAYQMNRMQFYIANGYNIQANFDGSLTLIAKPVLEANSDGQAVQSLSFFIVDYPITSGLIVVIITFLAYLVGAK